MYFVLKKKKKYKRHWISRRFRIVSSIQTNIYIWGKIWCHLSHVTCHLSHVTNTNSQSHGPPPGNSPTMHSRMLLLRTRPINNESQRPTNKLFFTQQIVKSEKNFFLQLILKEYFSNQLIWPSTFVKGEKRLNKKRQYGKTLYQRYCNLYT